MGDLKKFFKCFTFNEYKDINILSDEEAIKKDWETIGKDFELIMKF